MSRIGYHSVIQYCPDPARLEAVNLGVALLDPAERFVGVWMNRSNARVIQCFPKSRYDIKSLNLMKRDLAVSIENARLQTRDDLAHFAAMRVNLLQMTPPLPYRLEHAPRKALERLAEDFFGPADAPSPTGPHPRTRLRRAFNDGGLLGRYVRESVIVRLPTFGRDEEIPFAWQNGTCNLVQARRLTSSKPDDIERSATQMAYQGRDILKIDPPDLGLAAASTDDEADGCRLHVVLSLSEAARERKPFIERLFGDHDMRLIETDQIADYLGDVRAKAEPLAFDESTYGDTINAIVETQDLLGIESTEPVARGIR